MKYLCIVFVVHHFNFSTSFALGSIVRRIVDLPTVPPRPHHTPPQPVRVSPTCPHAFALCLVVLSPKRLPRRRPVLAHHPPPSLLASAPHPRFIPSARTTSPTSAGSR